MNLHNLLLSAILFLLYLFVWYEAKAIIETNKLILESIENIQLDMKKERVLNYGLNVLEIERMQELSKDNKIGKLTDKEKKELKQLQLLRFIEIKQKELKENANSKDSTLTPKVIEKKPSDLEAKLLGSDD